MNNIFHLKMENTLIEAYLSGIFSGYMSLNKEDWDDQDYWINFVQRKGLTDSIIGKWNPLYNLEYTEDKKPPASLRRLARIFYNKGRAEGSNSDKTPPIIDISVLKANIPYYIDIEK